VFVVVLFGEIGCVEYVMFLGIDLGTGSVKAVLLDESGMEIGKPSSYSIRVPEPGAAEADPGEWWEAVRTTVSALTAGRQVEAMSLCGQMHGLVMLDRDAHLLRPPILWPDTRSVQCLEAYRELSSGQRWRLANPAATGMTGPSLLWVRQHEPEVYDATAHILQAKDYLRLMLTGEVASEASDASGTLLYDVVDDCWYTSLLDALGIRDGLLPPLCASASVAGTLLPDAADALGLPVGLPVVAGAADTAAAIHGFGLRSGLALLTIGTGGQIVVIREQPLPDPAGVTHLYRAATSNRWYAMAAVQNVGLVLNWVLAALGVDWKRAYAEAFATPAGCSGLLFAPYISGERTPLLDPSVRAGWIGLGLEHGRGHMLRAAFEGVAFGLRRGLESLEAAGANVSSLFVTGGGAVDARWLQLLADVFGRPLVAVDTPAAAARGAAMLAAAAVGVDLTAQPPVTVKGRKYMPGPSAEIFSDIYSRSLNLYPFLRSMS
jgi:xylulokinase